jgi:hypothetical protein
MAIQFDKINPKFRQITDLLFFSDRMDLDLSNFSYLLNENYELNFPYLFDRFKKSCEIYWEQGDLFWRNRLFFLLSLENKNISFHIESYLEKKMLDLLKYKHEVNINYDIAYLQFIELCKIKHERKESLITIKNFLIDTPAFLSYKKILNVVNSFIPIIFNDFNEYVTLISKKITQSSSHYNFLLELEKNGIHFDKKPIIKLAYEILVSKSNSDKNIRAFFEIINDVTIRNGLKKIYKESDRTALLSLLNNCDYKILEQFHLRNIKNIIDLDDVADEIAIIYADKLYMRKPGHKKANADRLIRLLNIVPEINSKKILVYLSSNNKMSDIKYILSSFPELKKLAAFV